MRLPDRMIAVSEGTAERIQQSHNEHLAVFVGNNGIDPAVIADVPRIARTDLLFVGRLLDHKGVDVLIDAGAELVRRGTRGPSTIVGKGPEAQGFASAPPTTIRCRRSRSRVSWRATPK